MQKFGTDEFIKIYNDYSMIESFSNGDFLYHYTDLSGVLGIISNSYFWAADMFEFPDLNEGRIVLKLIRDNAALITENNNEINNAITELIGTDELIDSFISGNKGFVVSFSSNPNSEYMWHKFNNGNCAYEIIFDKEKLFDSLYFNKVSQDNGKERLSGTRYIKNGIIVYDSDKQVQIAKHEFEKLFPALPDDFTLKAKLEMYLSKMSMVGNYFKRADIVQKVSEREEEIRIMMNIRNLYNGKLKIEGIPEIHDDFGKRHCYLHFDENAIAKIVARDKDAYELLTNVCPTKINIIMKTDQ